VCESCTRALKRSSRGYGWVKPVIAKRGKEGKGKRVYVRGARFAPSCPGTVEAIARRRWRDEEVGA
jgi:hypothetical protein